MMSLRFVLVLLSATTAAGYDYDDSEEHDEFSLLQSQVEEMKVVKAAKPSALEDDDYEASSHSLCATKEDEVTHSEKAPNVAATLAEMQPAALQQYVQLESDDPAGAAVLRAVLLIMFFLLVLDGFRRCYLNNKAAVCSQPQDNAWVPLVNAAKSGDYSSFNVALRLQPALTRADTWGCTPLHFAAQGGSAAIVAALVNQGVEIDALDAHDETPLHMAARAGHAATCEVLVGAGSNINAVNKEGMTPLVVAGQANQGQSCRFLADSGAGVAGVADEDLPPLVVSQVVRKVFTAQQ